MASLTTRRPAAGVSRRSLLRHVRHVLMVLVVMPLALPAQEPPREYLVKAAFLFNFTQFVQWPAGTFPSPEAPIRIGLFGDDPFHGALDEAVRGETVRGRPLVVHEANRADALKTCQVVFVPRSELRRLDHLLEALGTAPILIIADAAGATERGAVIGLYVDGTKVRFEISPTAAATRNLRIDPQLLSLGHIVGGMPGVVPGAAPQPGAAASQAGTAP